MFILWRSLCYGVMFLIMPHGIFGYNFDLDNLILYESPMGLNKLRGSYFGYSVALLNGDNKKSGTARIFIGSPRANSSAYPQAKETGTAFSCPIRAPCKEWTMHQSRNAMFTDGSWLGGSISVQNSNNHSKVVVCGPRWLDQNVITSSPIWPMRGICYEADANDLPNSEVSVGTLIGPLREFVLWGHNTASATIGFCIHVVPDDKSEKIIFGCPGLIYFSGIPVEYILESKSLLTPNLDYWNISEEYSYSGYAVTSGYYFGRETGLIYATGAPRSEELRGKVVLFKIQHKSAGTPPKLLKKVGDQVGEYFGAALASCDVDGNGNDELIIGAPQWTKEMDEGRIYIFGGKDDNTFMKKQSFDGTIMRGRFGSTITCLGDVDYDGYADIAVGAPYNGNGVVYIYHGTRNGLSEQRQIIYGSKVTKGFGISISAPKDIDNNGHADIAVGAYLSDHVMLIRSKRAITMNVILRNLQGQFLEKSLKSFKIQICSSYNGRYPPQELSVTKELRIDENNQRAILINNGRNVTVHKYSKTLALNSPQCENFTIYISGDNHNYINPLTLSVKQYLHTSEKNGTLVVGKNYTTGEEYFCESCSVVSKIHASDEMIIPFAVECGDDRICNSHLSIELKTDLKNVNHYVIGSASYIELNVTVNNTGEEAYLAQAVVHIPISIRIRYMPTTCAKEETSEHTIITCDIDNPLAENKTKTVSLDLDMSMVPSYTEKLLLEAAAKTQSTDDSSGHNATGLLIKCAIEADIGIKRQTTKEHYSYTLKKNDEQLPNIAFQHIYQIKNYESTPITLAMLSVSIPTHWIHAGNEIELVKLNKTIGYVDSEQFMCKDAETTDTDFPSNDATIKTEWLIGKNGNDSSTFGPQTYYEYKIINEKVFSDYPENRTLHVNCTNPSVKWKTINCKFGPLRNAHSVAKLVLELDLLLSNFTPEIMEKKNIIFFTTNASVKIDGQFGVRQTIDNEPDLYMIGTRFIGYPPEYTIAPWIVPLSIVIGLLLLLLLVLGLFKFGFFNRNKKMELQALLKEDKQTTSGSVADRVPAGETIDDT